MPTERAREDDLPFIEACARRLRLDTERLRAEQFVVVREAERIVAFGRILPHGGVYELACVGVVEASRGRGLGRRVVQELIRRFPAPDVWLTTDIPAYFERLGFARADAPPAAITAKLDRVCARLRSDCVAMVLRKPT